MNRALAGLGCAALAVMLRATSVAAPPEPAVATAAPELIVGSSRGLEAWRWDGSAKRLISRGLARHPRWLDERSVLVLRPEVDGDLARGARLERIAVDSGTRSTVATLPPVGSGVGAATDPQWSFGLQSRDDFVVDASKRFACLTLMDRNANMASAWLFLRIDLATGKISRWFDLPDPGEGGAAAPDGVKAGKPGPADTCSPRATAATPLAPAPALPFTFDNEQIFEKKGGRRVARARLTGYSMEERSPSPSRRWLYLAGDLEEGDYIHRRLVLLDRATGDVFPIRPKGGTWPSPLMLAGRKTPPLYATPLTNTVGVVGESDVRWLGHAPDAEILIIDGLVIRPGAVSFEVRGEIAS